MEGKGFKRCKVVLAICLAISLIPTHDCQVVQRNYEDYLRVAANWFPWTEDVRGFTVVDSKSQPGMRGQEIVLERRPPFLPTEDRSYTVLRRVPFTQGMKYTEHIAYIRYEVRLRLITGVYFLFTKIYCVQPFNLSTKILFQCLYLQVSWVKVDLNRFWLFVSAIQTS